MTELISVIIPFYSNLDWLTDAVESVLCQTYKNYEIIVINDGSKEDISEFLSKYSDNIIYKKINHSGSGVARNIGIEISRGQFIAFLDADDLWLPDKLEKQLKYMKCQKLSWSHTSYKKFFDKNRNKTILVDVSKYAENIFPLLLTSCKIATPCVMVDANLLKLNPRLRFGVDVPHGQDILLWMKLALKEPIGAYSEPLTLVRIRGSNAALRARVQIEARANIYRSFHTEQIAAKVPKDILFVYRIIWEFNKWLGRFEKEVLRSQLPDSIAKVLYLPFWSFFKYKHLYYMARRNG